MKLLERRIWVTAILMTLGCVCTAWVRAGYTFEVSPLNRSLESIPLEMDNWRGENAAVDEHVNEILNAQETLDRSYHNADGSRVGLHISAWLRPDTVSEAAPHIPKVCYTNAGWRILNERRVVIETSDGELPIIMLLIERRDEKAVVAYWYQMGDDVFNSAEEAGQMHRKLWGQPKWPATVKVLMQTAGTSIDVGLPTIERFARLIRKQISNTPDTAAK